VDSLQPYTEKWIWPYVVNIIPDSHTVNAMLAMKDNRASASNKNIDVRLGTYGVRLDYFPKLPYRRATSGAIVSFILDRAKQFYCECGLPARWTADSIYLSLLEPQSSGLLPQLDLRFESRPRSDPLSEGEDPSDPFEDLIRTLIALKADPIRYRLGALIEELLSRYQAVRALKKEIQLGIDSCQNPGLEFEFWHAVESAYATIEAQHNASLVSENLRLNLELAKDLNKLIVQAPGDAAGTHAKRPESKTAYSGPSSNAPEIEGHDNSTGPS
jgi:hypothetical protein